MSDKALLVVFAAVVVLIFNVGLLRGLRKSRRTTRMFKIDKLYEKYETEDLEKSEPKT